MQYCVNHPYMFHNWYKAFAIATLQHISVQFVELLTVVYILVSDYPLSIVANFFVLTVITQFEQFIYSALGQDPFKTLLDDEVKDKVFIIQHTTSNRVLPGELSKVKDEDGNYRPLQIKFGDRTPINKLLFVFYRICRAWYVSWYFYFQPFSVFILAVMIPLIL